MVNMVDFWSGFLLGILLLPRDILGQDIPCSNLSTASSTTNLRDFLSTTFDYIIVGGGTAGIALAARLAENTNLTVGIIEAGYFHENDSLVDIPGLSGQSIGNPSYDWDFMSTPQLNAANRSMAVPRGKMLGGSSGINGLSWNRASRPEYDSWSVFAPNSSWTWDGLLPFFKKTERVFNEPPNPYPGITKDEAMRALHEMSHVDGSSGPIPASHNSFYFEIVSTLVRTLNFLGIHTNAAPEGGNATGVYNTYANVDPQKGVRVYSATAYLCQERTIRNLHVLTSAVATKIRFTNTTDGQTASGVEFWTNGEIFTANATREVILSSGTVQTPHLLELSGIGNPKILSAHDIPTIIDLPAVGENLQEHVVVAVQWRLKQGQETFDILRNNVTFASEQLQFYHATGKGLYAATDSVVMFLPLQSITTGQRVSALLDLFDEEFSHVDRTGIKALQYPIQRAWIEEGQVAHSIGALWGRGFIEPSANDSYIVLVGGIAHPTSRGSVHINSNDPLAPPDIDLNFLDTEFDILSVLEILKFFQTVGKHAPLADVIEVQTDPNTDLQNDDDLLSYIRSSCAGADHVVGTAAMAPREHGGVVDSSLRVYGTTNVRVVDASIIPIQIASNIQSTAYALAEKAAELILHVK